VVRTVGYSEEQRAWEGLGLRGFGRLATEDRRLMQEVVGTAGSVFQAAGSNWFVRVLAERGWVVRRQVVRRFADCRQADCRQAGRMLADRIVAGRMLADHTLADRRRVVHRATDRRKAVRRAVVALRERGC
jgi:hypothetical protein